MDGPNNPEDPSKRRFLKTIAKGLLVGGATGWLLGTITKPPAQTEQDFHTTTPDKKVAPKNNFDLSQLTDYFRKSYKDVYKPQVESSINQSMASIYEKYGDKKLKELISAKQPLLQAARSDISRILATKITDEIEDLALGLSILGTNGLITFHQGAEEKLIIMAGKSASPNGLEQLGWDQNFGDKLASDPQTNLTACLVYLDRQDAFFPEPGLTIAAFQKGEEKVEQEVKEVAMDEYKASKEEVDQGSAFLVRRYNLNPIEVFNNNPREIEPIYEVFAAAMIARRFRRELAQTQKINLAQTKG